MVCTIFPSLSSSREKWTTARFQHFVKNMAVWWFSSGWKKKKQVSLFFWDWRRNLPQYNRLVQRKALRQCKLFLECYINKSLNSYVGASTFCSIPPRKEKQPLFLSGEQGSKRLPATSPSDVGVLASCFSGGVKPPQASVQEKVKPAAGCNQVSCEDPPVDLQKHVFPQPQTRSSFRSAWTFWGGFSRLDFSVALVPVVELTL